MRRGSLFWRAHGTNTKSLPGLLRMLGFVQAQTAINLPAKLRFAGRQMLGPGGERTKPGVTPASASSRARFSIITA